MIKIFTPKSWRSLLGTASIIIEDDGRVYDADDEYKTFRKELAKIDYNDDCIRDYLGRKIGEIERNGDVIKVYGDDYYRSNRQPIFCIRDNIIYSGEDFHRLFPTELGYIDYNMDKSSSNNSRNQKSNSKQYDYPSYLIDDTDDYEDDKFEYSGEPSTFAKFLGYAFVIACVVLGLIFVKRTLETMLVGLWAEVIVITLISFAISAALVYTMSVSYYWFDPIFECAKYEICILPLSIIVYSLIKYGTIMNDYKELIKLGFGGFALAAVLCIIVGPIIYLMHQEKIDRPINKKRKRSGGHKKRKKPRLE